MAMTVQATTQDVGPMVEMNTTPLIDVMLVLLIMFIITIPPATHKLPLELPGKPRTIEVQALRNQLTVAPDGVARWNGAVVDDDELRALFREVATMDVPAEVHFAPDATARYERVDSILAMAKRADVRSIGFVGNDRYARAF